MRFAFTVEAELERSEGKFASRDELGEALLSELEGADPGQVDGDNGGVYEVTSWEVSEAVEVKAK